MYRFVLLTYCFLAAGNMYAQWNKPASNSLKQNISSTPVPEQVTFCGEKVPLEYFDTKESLRREMNAISYWHSSMIYTLQLSNRYMGTIEKLLKQYEVPDDMKYVCIAESNLQNLVSPSKAAGFWQFLSGTAKDFGLTVNSEIDERYNLEKSTKAACEYLKKAYDRFGNWTLAVASYNVGMSYISNQIEMQKQNSYYDMYLNSETSRYVFRAIAYKLIIQNPETYGFQVHKNDMKPLQYSEIEVTGPVNWIEFALSNGTNYKLLRMFNPWIIDSKLSSTKTYTVKIPSKREQ
ncbi:MAG: lytic transglycosylase domain-containing protein [Prevotellaceae bacterium]|nr:lytic transglycosylase domain-containing protein [Prevotellaceae bacterium]